jgi:transposase-like protein
MGAARKYEDEFMERAVRMYRDRLSEGTDSKVGARRHVGALLDVNPVTLRNWIEAEDRAARPAPTGEVVVTAEVRDLRRENAELRRTVDILTTSAAYFAKAEFDRRLR